MDLIGDASKARIAAFIIDNLIACLLAILSVGLIGSPNPYVSGSILGLVYLGYFFCFEALWSRTPGKFLQGLVVLKTDGSRCRVKDHIIRTLARTIEANPILLGGMPAGVAIFASARKQRIGDSLAGTVVVSRRYLDQ
ncbi:MAG TPA: hypothetical protein DC054_17195 [Blastocatellia bacterium]|nr:hypothetical protein [Blastocatellia bacterium]